MKVKSALPPAPAFSFLPRYGVCFPLPAVLNLCRRDGTRRLSLLPRCRGISRDFTSLAFQLLAVGFWLIANCQLLIAAVLLERR